MKIFSGLFLGLCVLTISCVQNDHDDSKTILTTELESIKSEYVPDRRLQIFDYEIHPEENKVTGRTSNQEAFNRVMNLSQSYPEVQLDSFFHISPLGTGLFNVSVSSSRSNPGHCAELSTLVLMGHEVVICEKDGCWSYMQSPDDYLGWVDKGALVVPDKAAIGD